MEINKVLSTNSASLPARPIEKTPVGPAVQNSFDIVTIEKQSSQKLRILTLQASQGNLSPTEERNIEKEMEKARTLLTNVKSQIDTRSSEAMKVQANLSHSAVRNLLG